MTQDNTQGTVLVTGAGRRLGRAIALDLAGSGWRVGVHYRSSKTDAQDVVGEIESLGGHAMALQADLARLEDLAPLLAACGHGLGPLTALINNAACFSWDWPDDFTETDWNLHHDVNLRAPVFLTQAFAKALPDGVEGNVINLIDQKVQALNPHHFSYTVAKSALWTATRTLAQALAPRVRVNAIAPGPVLPYTGQTDEDFELECRDTLLQRAVPVSDVTAAVRFLLETQSITGQMIAVDGGRHLAWREPPDEAVP